MSETVELTRFDGPHNQKSTIRVLEELAMDEWRKGIRQSYQPNTKPYYPPPSYPKVVTVKSIIDALNGINKRLKLLEKSLGGLGEVVNTLIAKLAKYDYKIEELESKIQLYECAE